MQPSSLNPCTLLESSRIAQLCVHVLHHSIGILCEQQLRAGTPQAAAIAQISTAPHGRLGMHYMHLSRKAAALVLPCMMRL